MKKQAAALILFALAAPASVRPDELPSAVLRSLAEQTQLAPLTPPPLRDEEDCGIQLMLCGQQFRSSLTTRDCKLEDGTHMDIWSFPILRAQPIGAAVSSGQFAPLLALFDSDINLLTFDTAGVNQIASLGYYVRRPDLLTLAVASTNPAQATGDYLLTLLCDLDKCTPDPYTLCLGNGRYRVQVAWKNQYSGDIGFGAPISKRTQAAGFFTFGDPSNVELLVKVLDFGDSVKVFYGQLTDLKFQMTVTDMVTNKSETYRNTPGNCGGLDQEAFDELGSASVAAAGACAPGKDRLCLLGRRFQVTVDWRNQYNGTSGQGGSTSLSDVTGAFYFTDPGNLELMVKMIDFKDRIAVFYGTLSDLEYSLRVEDTVTGQVKTYTNPAGKFCGGLDNQGF